jgi:hypothetical protein
MARPGRCCLSSSPSAQVPSPPIIGQIPWFILVQLGCAVMMLRETVFQSPVSWAEFLRASDKNSTQQKDTNTANITYQLPSITIHRRSIIALSCLSGIAVEPKAASKEGMGPIKSWEPLSFSAARITTSGCFRVLLAQLRYGHSEGIILDHRARVIPEQVPLRRGPCWDH